MKPLDIKKYTITHTLSCLPRKILKLHGRDNLAEFVMYELGKSDCFDLERVAYIIDNPDFNCLKGVAGLSRLEAYQPKKDIWNEPEEFTIHMRESPYNNKVRSFSKESGIKRGDSDAGIVDKFALDLGFTHPAFYAWPMKHDNHGILLYEKATDEPCDCEYLLEGLSLIGFCPVF